MAERSRAHQGPHPLITRALLTACALVLGGCGGYVRTVAAMNDAVAAGDLDRAVVAVSKELGAAPTELPDDLGGDKALLLLERGTLRYAAGDHARSSEDMQVADKHLEVLDLTDDTAGDIGRFLFSDDSKVYVAPPYEKLMLSTLNLVNYLAMGDLEGARVEARRLRIAQDLVRGTDGDDHAATALGSYVAGFAMEMSGQADEALRFYDEALAAAPFESLREPVRRLGAQVPWRGEHVDPIIAGGAPSPAPPDTGELLVVVGLGRVPHREPERIPIGLALTIAAAASGRHAMSQESRTQATELAAQGLVTWIMFPTLVPTPGLYDAVRVDAGGGSVPLELAADLGAEAVESFDELRGLLIGSAITRAITRALAGVATQESTKAAGGKGGLATLLSLAVQGGLAAADTPDTRSWVTLPRALWIGRVRVPAGPVTVRLEARGSGPGANVEQPVDVPAGGFRAVALTVLQ